MTTTWLAPRRHASTAPKAFRTRRTQRVFDLRSENLRVPGMVPLKAAKGARHGIALVNADPSSSQQNLRLRSSGAVAVHSQVAHGGTEEGMTSDDGPAEAMGSRRNCCLCSAFDELQEVPRVLH